MKPRVSVIVPIYNVEKYLRECLDSIVSQTLQDIEIILVDDCGTDGSMEIAAEFAKKDNRIKIITHQKNGGLSAARNTGIKNSVAPFIVFVDSDDFVVPAFCQKLLEAIEKSGADLAVCGTDIIYETDQHMAVSDAHYYEVKFEGLQAASDEIIGKCDVSACNKIFRREILEKYDIWFPEKLKYEDAFFFNAYMCWAKDIFFIPEKLYCYRRRAGSIMNQTFNGKPGHSIDHLKIGIAFYEYLKKYNLFPKRKDYMGGFFFSYLLFGLQNEPTKRGKADIYKLANQFLRAEKWESLNFSANILHQIKLTQTRTLQKSNNLLALFRKMRRFIFNLICAIIPLRKIRDKFCAPINQKLDYLNGRLDDTNKKLDYLSGKLDGINHKMEQKFDYLIDFLKHTTDIPVEKIPAAKGVSGDVQKISFYMLKEIDRICLKHGLTYWLDFGTLLGAVRHGGFIPWDDDMDISMPAQDYEKLKKVINSELEGTDFRFINVPSQIGKVVHKDFAPANEDEIAQFIFWNMKHKLCFALDIFPYYFLDEKITDEAACKRITVACEEKSIVFDNFKKYADFEKAEKLSKEANEQLSSTVKTKRMFLGMETLVYQPVLRATEDILPTCKITFETGKFSAPADIEAILIDLYGDYMQLPPSFVKHISIGDIDKNELKKLSREVKKYNG